MPTLRVIGRTDIFAGTAWKTACAIGFGSWCLGLLLIFWPDKSILVTERLLAGALALTAAWQFLAAFRALIGSGLQALKFLSAVAAVALAVCCLRSGDWLAVLTMWVGVGWMIRGIVQAIVAAWSDDLPDPGQRELYGLATLFVGGVVVLWPVDSVASLATSVGVGLMLLGATEIALATRVRRPGPSGEQVGVGSLLGPRAGAGVRASNRR